MMTPAETRAEAEAFVRRCVVGIPCSEREIIKASTAVFNAFTWHIDAIRRCGSVHESAVPKADAQKDTP